MFTKIAKALLYVVFIGMFMSAVYVCYFYFEGFMITRSALNSIVDVVANENCLASEDIYKDVNTGTAMSSQDRVKRILDNYNTNQKRWYLSFDTNNLLKPNGNLSNNNEQYTLSVTYQKNGATVVADSYVKAAPKYTVIDVSLKSELSMVLRMMPDKYSGGKFVLTMPIKVSAKTVALKYYKGMEDNNIR